MQTKPVIEKARIEDVLDRYGTAVWSCKGRSMHPTIREKGDLVVLERIRTAPAPYDIVMYTVDMPNDEDGEARRYVLHRFIRREADTCVILGDNCAAPEYVPDDKVIAVMTGLLRAGKRVDTGSVRHRLYLALWIKPWRLRMVAIRARNRLAGTAHRFWKQTGSR